MNRLSVLRFNAFRPMSATNELNLLNVAMCYLLSSSSLTFISAILPSGSRFISAVFCLFRGTLTVFSTVTCGGSTLTSTLGAGEGSTVTNTSGALGSWNTSTRAGSTFTLTSGGGGAAAACTSTTGDSLNTSTRAGSTVTLTGAACGCVASTKISCFGTLIVA